MSDQQDKNIEQLAQETAASGEDMQNKPDPGNVPDESPEAIVNATPPAPKGSSALAWIALLLVLVVAAGLGWSLWQQQGRDAGITARLQAIEAAAARKGTDADELKRSLQGQLKTAIGQVQGETAGLDSRTDELVQSLAAVQSELAEQRSELTRYSADDRDDWLLAEAQYLLRMANQRLLMAGDVAAAQALLGSADNILLRLDDVRLHEVRAAVAADLAAVRAVPRVDVEGVYLRLSALVEQAGKLVIFRLPQQPAQAEPEPAQDWQGRLRQGYEAALAKLSNYIIIRRRDEPMQALMDPQWEGLVRQNLRMLLEQAQVALLSGNQVLYRESLGRAQHWVAEFATSDEAAAQAMSREISQLAGMDVVSRRPDISRSLQAFDAFMQQRMQQGGAE